ATLPCMSHSPSALGGYEPTFCVRPRTVLVSPSSKLAWLEESVSPKEYARPSPPPRQAYSHSASLGRRYFTRTPSSPAARSLSFTMNSFASCHETFSTGKSSSCFWVNAFTLFVPPPGLLFLG